MDDAEQRTSSPSFAGLILAGGMGRRWGGPKAWARLPDGSSFLEACTVTLRRAGADPLLATLPHGDTTPPPPACSGRCLPSPDLDMFSSLCWGLETLLAHGGWHLVVVLPVDHPLVRPATIRTLVAAGPPAAIPTLAGRHGHPLTLAREAAAAVVGGELSGPTLREVLRALATHEVVVDDPGVRANCNTTEALAAALR